MPEKNKPSGMQQDAAGEKTPPKPVDERGRIKGVFSTQTVSKIGTGSTSQKSVQKQYFMVVEQEDGQVEVQYLNKNYVPAGPKRLVPKDEILEQFSPEPEFYAHTVYPKMRELQKTVARADRHRQRGENYSAEYEYGNALKVDEENIRANFGLGLTYLDRGATDKADDIFKRLVQLDAAFEEEHKHLFNDFGISLRKNKMYEQCLQYYKRALELSKTDEHLLHNVARLLFEQDKVKESAKYLEKALKLNPDFEEAKQFMRYLEQKGYLD
ncbi:MAG: tetratricopeptide repeat protein [Desulfohalobiaceae bacterium]